MSSFKFSLNASTLFPFKLSVLDQIRIAGEAGYDGIELWVGDIQQFLKSGGTPEQLRTELRKARVVFANAIAFFKWADADADVREEGFRQAEEEMRMLKDLGCLAVAAPPFGQVKDVSIESMGDAYHRLVQLGRSIGIEPYLEFWGRAEQLSTLETALAVAEASGIRDSQILLDPFHMYTGGTEWTSLEQLTGNRIGIVHINDYPEIPSRADIADRDRLFPGDGIAPLERLRDLLEQANYSGYLSLELFIEDYQGQSALEVAIHGYRKMADIFRKNR
ncbi:sugar phosphate isomerase/epimerase family protein [Paenibacillus spongiae]|uniref:Sugar phosphate isomerase/epimerase n=1 Tax=Paenibacillus spongiae TaxID=2909671 RepID=A0ABY5SJ94_9BACL|nr:sugar phosphate isomerase/epimerase family protein [Paenibacillus spongiae]UVI32673.1 sugar phosphate isomerase/epimerase [Paenibacillus spongiae]